MADVVEGSGLTVRIAHDLPLIGPFRLGESRIGDGRPYGPLEMPRVTEDLGAFVNADLGGESDGQEVT